MDDCALDRLLSGDLNSLIELPKRVVRLFISSTFTDMTLERNSLMERVYPRLKKYCRERHGLDFQVVDMRWGVRDEATDDHQTVNLCSREINNCKRVSLGPNFVALLGDKYGFRPLCSRIKSIEYRALRRCLIELDISTDFLDTWYKEDLNAVPPEYLLQPISSILVNFTNKSEPELQSIDQCIWQAIQERLRELLVIGSSRLVKQGKLNEQEQLMKYSISVTEREVIEGCLDVNDAKSHCLVYVRTIVDLRLNLEKCLANLPQHNNALTSGYNQPEAASANDQEHKDSPTRRASLKIGDDTICLTTSGAQSSAERKLERTRKLIGNYIDLNSKENVWRLDQEAQEALSNLKESKLDTKLGLSKRNLTRYKVFWNEQDGMSMKCEQHKHYINELTEHFYANMTRMIRKSARSEHKLKTGLTGEVLQHSHYAKHVSKSFHGRSEELNKIRSYILCSSGNILMPMFAYGVGGSGKTSIMARAATLANNWILEAKQNRREMISDKWNQKPCIVMRFCSTTPDSSSMVGVLTSVCRQLQFNFYQFGPLNGMNQFDRGAGEPESWSEANLQLPYQQIPDDFIHLVFTFRQLLDNCQHPLHRGRLFVILLDSIERLSSPPEISVDVKYSWLTSIAKLPANVRLIVSCGSEKAESWAQDYVHLKRHFLLSFYKRLNEKYPEYKNSQRESHNDNQEQIVGQSNVLSFGEDKLSVSYVASQIDFGNGLIHNEADSCGGRDSLEERSELSKADYSSIEERQQQQDQQEASCDVWVLHIKPLGVKLALEVIGQWLVEVGRNLSQMQWSLVEKSFTHCSRPIFVKLTYGEVVNWKSYSMQGDTRGLTFGSSVLEGESTDLVTGDISFDSAIGSLRRTCEEETPDFKWQLLCLEQQWLNYLDFKQRESKLVSDTGDTQEDGSMVIRIGTAGGAKASVAIGSGSASVSICHLSNTIYDAINQLFARIELQHGHLLTKHSLSYITAARNGLSENELEDILSLDDIVLDDVFQYHLPPVRRMPPLLWTRIRNDLPDYLSERDADGIVVNWHHSQFKRATRNRYLSDHQHVRYIHSIMADYFLGKWADKAKPFRCTRQQIQMAAEQLDWAIQQPLRDSQSAGSMSARKLSHSGSRLAHTSSSRSDASFSVRSRLQRISDQQDERFQWMQAKADRRVPQQPLHYSNRPSDSGQSDQTNKTVPIRTERNYNLRKLTELPHHLICSGRHLELASGVLFNYKWLFAALDALGLQCVLSDFGEAKTRLQEALSDLQLAESTPGSNQEQIQLDKGELGIQALQSIIDQLDILNNTIRLSCSAIRSDTQMLAPQLIGRLIPLVQRSKTNANKSGQFHFLAQLLEQCDKDGSSDCALLPTDHCLQSPEGMQLSSLEGHSFAIMSMALAADQRHLLAVSNRFIMWDISTGQVSRDVDPNIEGSIMKELKMGANNDYALSFTSNNLILLLDLLTQQVTKFTGFLSELDPILGLNLIDKFGATRFVTWTKSRWFVLRVINNELQRTTTHSPQRLSIELDYSSDLSCLDIGYIVILNVQIVAGANKLTDLICVEAKVKENKLQLITLRAYYDSEWLFEPWEQRVEASTMSLDASLRQFVYSNSRGDVYLSRRRSTRWSNPKLVRKNTSEFNSTDDVMMDLARQLNRMHADVGPTEVSAPSNPLVIELLSEYNPSAQLDPIMLANGHDSDNLAYFERQIDAASEEAPNEFQSNSVFEFSGTRTKVDARQQQTMRYRKQKIAATRIVKLYFSNKITLVYLDRKNEKTLRLPKHVRNISVDLNRCQIKSVILTRSEGDEILVAAVGRRLLFYSIDQELLLRSVDAHSSRIVKLVPIFASELTSQRSSSNGSHNLICVASGSMDKSVKIWNLANLEKDNHLLDRMNNGIEWLCLSNQLPLAACLARGELAIWNWWRLKLLARVSLQTDLKIEDPSSKIVKSGFSLNGRYLCVATTSSINLLSIEGYRSSSSATLSADPLTDQGLRLKLNFKHSLPAGLIARKASFFAQDSRVLILLESEAGETFIGTYQESAGSANGSERELASDSSDSQLTRRLLLLCYSSPDGRQLYSIDFQTPTMLTPAGESHYLTMKTASDRAAPGGSHKASVVSGKRVCLPVMTRDELSIVTVELAASESGHRRHQEQRQILTRDQERRKSSEVSRLMVVLNVYSSRDGTLINWVDLSRVELYDPGLEGQQQKVSTGCTSLTGRPEASGKSKQQISIFGDQFSRLKALTYRERQSVVALIEEDKGMSYLVDVNTRRLVASSSVWNGKVSRDGRFGLGWISGLQASSPGEHCRLASGGGLQLVEMRRWQPVRTLIDASTLAQLRGSELHSSTSEADISCGFTRPNHVYVYYHDSRLGRLLLVRVSDAELVANYKLASRVSSIKSANDGSALVLAMADGSLCSLAIVDPQKSDTLARLSQYPSRKKL